VRVANNDGGGVVVEAEGAVKLIRCELEDNEPANLVVREGGRVIESAG
jgi:hypothetical protein